MLTKSNKYYHTLIIRLMTIILAIWPALYNGFPLVTSDSGTYIYSGIYMSLPIDRPWAYGIFVAASSLHLSLWGIILWQGIIFTWLVRTLCKELWGDSFSEIKIGLITAFISLTTAAAWVNSQIMADFFTAMLLLSLFLLYLRTIRNKKSLWLYLFIIFCAFTHNTHILILIFGSLLFFIILWRNNKSLIPVPLKLLGIGVFSLLATSFMNWIKFNDFSSSPMSHVFLISRMAEQDILEMYLEKECPNKNYSLCELKGNIGNRQWDFMWQGDAPHLKENGLLETKKEYNAIINGIITDPYLLSLFILKSIESTGKQLTQIYVGDGFQAYFDYQGPNPTIERFFPHQKKEYHSSLQQIERLNTWLFNTWMIKASLFLCFLAIAFSQINLKYLTPSKIPWSGLLMISLVFILLNAALSATLSTVIARLNVRVFWILPLLSTLYMVDIFKRISPQYNLFKLKSSQL